MPGRFRLHWSICLCRSCCSTSDSLDELPALLLLLLLLLLRPQPPPLLLPPKAKQSFCFLSAFPLSPTSTPLSSFPLLISFTIPPLSSSGLSAISISIGACSGPSAAPLWSISTHTGPGGGSKLVYWSIGCWGWGSTCEGRFCLSGWRY